MNKFIGCGRLTRDPEVRVTTGDKPTTIARFSLAVNRKFKREGQPDADFFNCVSFGKQAEFVEKYIKKGSKVLISGRLENNNYEKDGQTVYSNQISIEEIEFAESKNAEKNTENNSDGFMSIPDGLEEDLPFN